VVARQIEYADTVALWVESPSGAFDTARLTVLLHRMAPWATHVAVGEASGVDYAAEAANCAVPAGTGPIFQARRARAGHQARGRCRGACSSRCGLRIRHRTRNARSRAGRLSSRAMLVVVVGGIPVLLETALTLKGRPRVNGGRYAAQLCSQHIRPHGRRCGKVVENRARSRPGCPSGGS
jgi:hypothetical protein